MVGYKDDLSSGVFGEECFAWVAVFVRSGAETDVREVIESKFCDEVQLARV